MGAYTRDNAIEHAWRLLRDVGQTGDSQFLTDTDLQALLGQVEVRYSGDRPRELVADVIADGSATLALPASFVQDWSRVVSIEELPLQATPAVADERTWRLYRAPAGQVVRWLDGHAPASGQGLRITYTGLRGYGVLAADTTVLDTDHHAVASLLASLGADAIAAKFARTHEPVLSADVVQYGSKSQDWRSIAKRLEALYLGHLGTGPDEAPPAPASGWVNWDPRSSSGQDYLFHGRRHR